MPGKLLMIIGIIFFISGLYLYKTSDTEKAEATSSTTVSEVRSNSKAEGNEVVKETENKEVENYVISTSEHKENNQPLHALERAIEMAIADGVLTENEKKVIKQITEENNLDYSSIIKGVETRIAELTIDSETELIDVNKKNGNEFESFIVQKFNKKYFKIGHVASVKTS